MSCYTTGAGTTQTGRVLLVYDKQSNLAAPTILNVLNTISPTSQKNLDNRKRFRILMDKTFDLGAKATGVGERLTFEKYIKLNTPVQYNTANNGTIADIVSGSLYLITLGDVASGADDATSIITARVRFSDT